MIVGPDGDPTPQKPQVKVDVMSQPNIKCSNCEGIYFEQVVMFKKVSKLLTGAPIDQIAPIEIFRCCDCGTPCKDLQPK